MIDERARAIARIRKMLRMAEGQANQHEAEVAASMAAKLMAKYNVDYADVIAREIQSGDGAYIVEMPVEETAYLRSLPTYYNVLVTAVCEVLACVPVYRNRYPRADGTGTCPVMIVRGYKDDVQMVIWLSTYILRQIEELANYSWKSEVYPTMHDAGIAVHASKRRSYKNNHKYGAVMSIIPRVQETYRAQAEDSVNPGGTELQCAAAGLAEIKRKAIALAFGAGGKLLKATGGRDYAAIAAGQRDGNSVNINRIVRNDVLALPAPRG
jgi:hypothetical protein